MHVAVEQAHKQRLKVAAHANPGLKLSLISYPHCKCALKERDHKYPGQFARSKRLSSLAASRFAKMTPAERSAEGRRRLSLVGLKEKRGKAKYDGPQIKGVGLASKFGTNG
jgi:hypothetical protein